MIKCIIGYIDSHGSIHSHVVKHGDRVDSHVQVWPSKIAAHGKWRWNYGDAISRINTYGEYITDDELFAIVDLIEKHIS